MTCIYHCTTRNFKTDWNTKKTSVLNFLVVSWYLCRSFFGIRIANDYVYKSTSADYWYRNLEVSNAPNKNWIFKMVSPLSLGEFIQSYPHITPNFMNRRLLWQLIMKYFTMPSKYIAPKCWEGRLSLKRTKMSTKRLPPHSFLQCHMERKFYSQHVFFLRK